MGRRRGGSRGSGGELRGAGAGEEGGAEEGSRSTRRTRRTASPHRKARHDPRLLPERDSEDDDEQQAEQQTRRRRRGRERAPPPPPVQTLLEPPPGRGGGGHAREVSEGAAAFERLGAEFSFARFVSSEVNLKQDVVNPDQRFPPLSRVYNFLTLPLYLERFLAFGFLLCLDMLLFHVTFQPWRATYALLRLLAPVRCRRVRLNKRQRLDLLHAVIVAWTLVFLSAVDMSRVYHYIRGQSVLKLYVLFNMLQIVDRLCTSFGEDILEALAASVGRGWFHTAAQLAVSCWYCVLHSVVLFAMTVTLNVSVNSNNSSLFVLLVSNNFVELKSSVFKRFRPPNLFQVSCSDVVERFQLFCFVCIIFAQNLSHMGLELAGAWVSGAGLVAMAIMASEVVVDWIKHGFMTKFNLIEPSIYRRFSRILCGDYTAAHSRRHLDDTTSAHSVARRIGLVSLPMCCIVLRVAWSALAQSSSAAAQKLALAAVVYAVLCALKLLLSVVLLGHSAKHAPRRTVDDELAGTDRYRLMGNRVPA